MQKNLLGKTIFIIAILIAFAFGIIGIPQQWSGAGLKAALLDRIHLGLDLKGGMHLILQVQVNDAVNADTDITVERLKDTLTKAGVRYGEITKPDAANHPELIEIHNVSSDTAAQLRDAIGNNNNFADYTLGSAGLDNYSLTMKPAAVAAVKNAAVTQSIETIRSRIDALGVSEPVIEEHGLGQYQILVQLPGIDDFDRVKGIMQSTAMLEIRQAVDNTPYPTEDAARQAHNGILPPNAVILPGNNVNANSNSDTGQSYYIVSRSSVVAGRDIRDAKADRSGETGQPIVNFFLTNAGGQRFRTYTAAHQENVSPDHWIAVVLDNRVREVASIKSEIGDSGMIEGGFTEQSAKDLATMLRSGALPAGIRYLQEETVGPSLGADSIKAGVRSAVIGFLVVMIFMLIYYRAAGINADLALILNLVILMGFLGFSGATLTLPGIAGVILTVGMGVDSNVLIFERIREELRNGKSAAAAVDQGFDKAFRTIIDTHVTTIVSAFILFIFGTGPVKGFAVTLTFGLLANIFTAVYVSRVIFDAALNRHQRGEALSI
jgi:preprotein translocase subunit SecD